MSRVLNIVAYGHTHPNSLSGADINYAARHNINAYVVGPNLLLQRYNVANGTTVVVSTILPVGLTEAQRSVLVSMFRASWDSHIVGGICSSGFGCGSMAWPNS